MHSTYQAWELLQKAPQISDLGKHKTKSKKVSECVVKRRPANNNARTKHSRNCSVFQPRVSAFGRRSCSHADER